ncbi:RNA polymerase sporulation sigma factor SigH [Anaerotalea alkaliphila]|uniref:RNA polymerase sporulation sigma factor SigH n=1 Tax=Anaerotalea alkaliphila TaxID=2662126 RepID=A0A7X5HWZ1_9FIRM|nr:RNA polymerase sporulation sigma factor SigH [Anaerotalea alkaliphila]NDL68210.1 RNA polymerase sporulation sigma factor SigH [Anaerotalea alkaliphila]
MEKKYRIENLLSYTDEELVGIAHQGHDFALDFLLNKYKMLVEKKAKSYFLIGGSKEDIIQEGMIGLFKAVRDYKGDKDASFHSFADLCVTRQMITAVKASTRQKHMPLNSYISLNKQNYQDEDDKSEMLEHIANDKVTNPEELFIGKENLGIIEQELSKVLSGMEKEVLQRYVEGTGYVEIAAVMDRPVKSIDNALQRIKKKVEKVLKEKIG